MDKPNIQSIWKALAQYGIHTEKELDEAIQSMKPLNIGCMVSPIEGMILDESKASTI